MLNFNKAPELPTKSGAVLTLSEFVSTLVRSIIAGSQALKGQHISGFLDFFEPSGQTDPVSGDAIFKPKTIAIDLPRTVINSDDLKTSTHVPLATLAHHSGLAVEEASIDVSFTIVDIADRGEPDSPQEVLISLNRTRSGAPAKIVLRLKSSPLPEGLSRVDDSLVKALR